VHLLRILNLNRLASQSGQPLISFGRIKDVKIPLPPLPQQKHIAAVLDEADKLRQLNKQLIAKYEQLSQSLFLEMFGDIDSKIHTFNEIADNKMKGTFSNGPFGSDLLTSELTDKGIPVIYIRDLKNGQFNWKSNVFVTKEKAAYLKNCQVIRGDVLISKVGDPPGVAAICPSEIELAIITQDVIRLRVNNDIANSEYIKFWFNSTVGQHALKAIIVEGTRKRFGLGDLKKLKISIPPIELQNLFAERIQAIEAQKAQAQQALAKSEQLFGSLLQRAFKGELV